jgi:hypothetical protein
MKLVLEDLKIHCKGSTKLFCDNKSDIGPARNPVKHDRTKHIGTDLHFFIKGKLDSGLITTTYIPSRHHLSNVLTKEFTIIKIQPIYLASPA